MKFKVIMTGSSGNCAVLTYENTTIVIDAGFKTKKEIVEALDKYEKIDGILITHNHSDHASKWTGKYALERKIPVYMVKPIENNDNFRKEPKFVIAATKTIPERVVDKRIISFDEEFFINDVKVKPFKVFHDSAGTTGFVINDNFGYVTDTGFIDYKMKKALLNVTHLALEFNYDLPMLLNSDRFVINKLRCIGREGHLQNEEAVKFVNFLAEHGKLQEVYTMHMSRSHNSKELIEEALKQANKKIKFHILQRFDNEEIQVSTPA